MLRLAKKSISVLSTLLLVVLGAGAAAPQMGLDPFESQAAPVSLNKIDDLVWARLMTKGLSPARPCSDAVFLRRAFLDVIGTLPTADEARDFLADGDSGKRSRLIDRLLARDEFADYWGMKWSELLRVKSEFPINLWPDAVQAYDRWIRTAIKENRPYDRFARDLLTASGSNFRDAPVNFYRAVQGRDPQSIAQAVALTFMGERAEKWPKDKLAQMAVFFSKIGYKATSEWKEEIVYFDPAKASPGAASGGAATAVFPDGTPARLTSGRDPRQTFADWLTAPGNRGFARAVVNRIWTWLLGRGIVNEPDDMRADNPPAVPELLDYLERELISAKYDLKAIYRLILNSATYQLSSRPSSDRPESAVFFAHYAPRRLDAEVIIDAINEITGATDHYSSPIPEPYTFIPESVRSIDLPDGSITSAFLEMFGRSPRDTGLESERNGKPTAGQRLHLLNSSHIQRKIQQGPKLKTLVQPRANPLDNVNLLYLTVLSRFPTAEEIRVVAEYFKPLTGNKWPGVVDLVWALVNSPEFLYRH